MEGEGATGSIGGLLSEKIPAILDFVHLPVLAIDQS
jgi:hypothetical protein